MWNGKLKAVTFSFDDGVLQDKRTIDILNKYNLKCYGFTATPKRNDSIDVLEDFYNNVQVTPLYLDEAIEQNVLPDLK